MRLADLIHAHVGRPAFVMGGGPRAPAQFAGLCPPDAVLISANYHGCLLTRCDYVVSQEVLDETHAKLRTCGAPIVSPHPEADYRIECPVLSVSGMEAARVAWVLGCAPIILAGMDCFMDAQEHWHRPERLHTYGRDGEPPLPPRKLHKQLTCWKEMAEAMPNAMLRTAGGPLGAIFRPYDPKRPALPPASVGLIRAAIGG